MAKKEISVIIAGIGGQGINGFARLVHEHCASINYHCVSAVYKGGAQRLGSVHAEIRIFSTEVKNALDKTSQILPGTLDLLIGLEQWETLRYISFCHAETNIMMDSFQEFPPGIKQNKTNWIPPEEQLKKAGYSFVQNDFSRIMKEQSGSTKGTLLHMWNNALEKMNCINLIIKK